MYAVPRLVPTVQSISYDAINWIRGLRTGPVDRKIKIFDGAELTENFAKVVFVDVLRQTFDDNLLGSS